MITFIIPAYQAEATLRRSIDSILRQTDGRYKIIVIDDGSTDRTGEIAGAYEKKYPKKVLYLRQENLGPGAARNRGIELADTEYISFLDSDDWLMPEYVERILKRVEERPVEMVMTLPVIYHEGSEAVGDWYDKLVFMEVFSTDGIVVNPSEVLQLYRFEVNVCRKILKKEFIDRIHFRFPEGIKWEDVVPHFYLLSQCRECIGISDTGFYYRIGDTGQVTSSKGRDRLDILRVFEELLAYTMEEKKAELEFPVMRVFVRFSIWCMKMTEGQMRRELVNQLHLFFRKVPKRFFSALKEGTKGSYSKADARQYRLFLMGIRYKPFYVIFYDYFYQEAAEKLIKKVLGARERVA